MKNYRKLLLTILIILGIAVVPLLSSAAPVLQTPTGGESTLVISDFEVIESTGNTVNTLEIVIPAGTNANTIVLDIFPKKPDETILPPNNKYTPMDTIAKTLLGRTRSYCLPRDNANVKFIIKNESGEEYRVKGFDLLQISLFYNRALNQKVIDAGYTKASVTALTDKQWEDLLTSDAMFGPMDGWTMDTMRLLFATNWMADAGYMDSGPMAQKAQEFLDRTTQLSFNTDLVPVNWGALNEEVSAYRYLAMTPAEREAVLAEQKVDAPFGIEGKQLNIGYALTDHGNTYNGTNLYTQFSFILERIVEKHDVLYSGNGHTTGTLPDTVKHEKGDTVTVATSDITKDDFNFKGWTDGTTTYQAGDTFTMPDEPVTLAAIWEAKTYTVTFDSKGGSAVDTIENIAKSAKITAPLAPTKDGYTFIGWYTDDALTTAWNFASDAVTADITLYAKWEEVTTTELTTTTTEPTTITTDTATDIETTTDTATTTQKGAPQPATGDTGNVAVFYLAAVALLASFIVLRKRKNEENEEIA